jgi:hypothetical protein
MLLLGPGRSQVELVIGIIRVPISGKPHFQWVLWKHWFRGYGHVVSQEEQSLPTPRLEPQTATVWVWHASCMLSKQLLVSSYF